MSDGTRRFFINGILLTVVGLAIRTVTLFFNAYVTGAVGAAGIGLHTLIMTVYGFAVTFATSGIGLTVTRLVASCVGDRAESEVSVVLCGAILYALAFGLGASLLLFFLAPAIARHALADLRAVLPMRILSLSLLPVALSAVFGGYFVGIKRVVGNATAQVLTQVFKIVSTCVLMTLFGPMDVLSVCLLLAAVSCATDLVSFLVLLVLFCADRRGKARGFDVSAVGDVVGMAIPLALSAYIRSALLTLEHILIPHRLRLHGESAEEAVGAYGILHGMALPVILYPISPLTSFSGLLVPEFAQERARSACERMERMASRALNATLVYGIGIAVLLAFFSEEIGYCVYRSYDAGHFIAMLAPILPVMYLDHVTDQMLKGIGEHVYSMWVNITDSLLSVLLVWLLLPSMGIAGYAVVIMVMEGYNFLFSVGRLRRRVRFSVHPVGAIVLPLLSALLAVAVAHGLFITDGRAASGFWLGMKMLFAGCLFLLLQTLLDRGWRCVKSAFLQTHRPSRENGRRES